MKADETQRHQTEAGTEIECSQSRAEEISVCVCVCERERERERERMEGGGGGREREEDSEIQRIVRETHLTPYLGARMGESSLSPPHIEPQASNQPACAGCTRTPFSTFLLLVDARGCGLLTTVRRGCGGIVSGAGSTLWAR